MKIGEYTFRTVTLDDDQRIVSLPIKNTRGIYIYEFTDGTFYVGKSSNVMNRHTSHLLEYRNEVKPLVIKQMWWAGVRGSDKKLDDAETFVIREFEKDHSLRNTVKASMPGGKDDINVDAGDGSLIYIPWDRQKRLKSRTKYTFEEKPFQNIAIPKASRA